MSAIIYPPTLPAPAAAPLQPAERRLLTELPGLADAAGIQRDFLAQQSLEFVFSFAQAADFQLWWARDLLDGAAWFSADWPVPTGWRTAAVRRFVPGARWVLIPGYGWRVSIESELRGAGLAPVAVDG